MASFAGEFDRQLETLIDLGYAEANDLTPAEFLARFAGLRAVVSNLSDAPRSSDGKEIPFVIVPARGLAPAKFAMERVERGAGAGVVSMSPKEPADFLPTPVVSLPTGDAYLAIGVETGTDYLNVTPANALQCILGSGRSPLTLEEGVAVITQFPQSLRKNACFSLPGSRAGDKRVPALWLSNGRPKLGWCWEGNPHTWLGSASCAGRIGAN